MNREQYSRTEALLGTEALNQLRKARVIVFGVGGVGGYVVEALARSGVGALDLVDKDVVSISNLNRQIIALQSTVGRSKVEVMKERIADIDPDCVVRTYEMLYLPETADQFDFTQYDYVVDAIDTVAAKIDLVLKAKAAGVPVIC
ncbi:MAG: ThiF family adenylyltransferase, partial [Firmicutes bacterium]|nr:ThiF family adenylyltransferase [Bacillota bacterium]